MSQDNHLIIEKDGYPLQIESIQTLNDGVQQALTNIAAVCGSNTILKGCADEVREGVTYVTDGIMCIGGKIYQFRGGKKTGGVTIITTKVDDIYDTGDGSAKQMLPVRGFSYVTSSPEGSSNIAWSSFVKVSDLKGLSELIPKVDKMYGNRIIGSRVIAFSDYPPNGSASNFVECDENIENANVILLTSVRFKYKEFWTKARHYSSIQSKSGNTCQISIGFIDNVDNEQIEITAAILKV
ncbi:hypothetical protein HX017_15545 [Myroides marinus]|uniref:hypothetical protein n=1 Tax=Myroides marinus TaxID=703342 RepID=UPI002578FF74|nr:hypothetical protein [Myroides marinus]MDM1366355.1 hypothetical protein [Myroides marinus]